MDIDKFEKEFWYFYLELENDFLEIEKSIPVDSLNSETFSYKYMKLLESICAEVDVIFKVFLQLGTSNDRLGIKDYESEIEDNFQNFKNAELTCFPSRYGNNIVRPFKDWTQDKPPHWWTINNKLKHHRNEMDNNGRHEWYKHANQENTLDALGGLFQLNLFYYKELIDNDDSDNEYFDVPVPTSNIFRLENWGDYYKYLVGNYPITGPLATIFEKLAEKFEMNHD